MFCFSPSFCFTIVFGRSISVFYSSFSDHSLHFLNNVELFFVYLFLKTANWDSSERVDRDIPHHVKNQWTRMSLLVFCAIFLSIFWGFRLFFLSSSPVLLKCSIPFFSVFHFLPYVLCLKTRETGSHSCSPGRARQ